MKGVSSAKHVVTASAVRNKTSLITEKILCKWRLNMENKILSAILIILLCVPKFINFNSEITEQISFRPRKYEA